MKKCIRLFLASSVVEFEKERRELAAFISKLNNIYHSKGIFFELVLCEDLSAAVAIGRKQDEYNQIIRQSRYFYMLLGRKAGVYTVEEYEVALEQFRSVGWPRIYAFFKQQPEGEDVEQSIVALERKLGQCYETFTSMDSVKYKIMLDLSGDTQAGGRVEILDGWAFLDDQPMLRIGKEL